ncbi:MAG TPA: hypothetical protein VN832_00005, partial [Stellaceae bacterium]|nr:hypothetical protein [Stellaceae bacterium]
LIDDRGGAMGIILAVMFAALVVVGGVAVDFARAAQVKSMLQGIVDAAATSGASAYVSASTASTAAQIATNFMNNGIASLPSNGGVTFTVTTGTTSANGSTTGYTVSITASAQPPTTLLSVIQPSLPTSLSATATNPVAIATVDFGNFSSSACDGNTIYWYIVPADNSIPSDLALNEVFTNVNSNGISATSFPIPVSQRIGFALQNVTGQNCAYGSNQYGGTQGSTRYFYSQLNPPSSSTYSQVTQNCSLQVATVSTAASNAPMPAAPSKGACLAATPTNAAPNCATVGNQTFGYYWNDMGGANDDYDFNDAEYTFSCAMSSGGAPNVALTH